MKRVMVLVMLMAVFVIAANAAVAGQGFEGVPMGKRLSLLRTQLDCSANEIQNESSWHNVRSLQDELIGAFERLDKLVSNGKKGFLTGNQNMSDRALVEFKMHLKESISMAIVEIGLWNGDMSREQTLVKLKKINELIDSMDALGRLYNGQTQSSKATGFQNTKLPTPSCSRKSC